MQLGPGTLPAYIPCVSHNACGFVHFVSSEHALSRTIMQLTSFVLTMCSLVHSVLNMCSFFIPYPATICFDPSLISPSSCHPSSHYLYTFFSI